MPQLKKQREEIFSQNLARGMPVGEAYVAAGYHPNPGNPSRLKGTERIRKRVAEIQQQTHQQIQRAVVQQATITRQYLVDALIENIEKSLARKPIEIGPGYVYRAEAANSAIKMAGNECGLFKDKAEVTHKMDFSELSDDELLLRLRDETDALLRERAERAAENGDDELARKLTSGRGAVIAVRAKAN